MTIKAYTFDRETVPASADARFQNLLSGGGGNIIMGGNNLAATSSGLTITIDTGAAYLYGRMIELTAPESIGVDANSTGYICFEIDTTKANTSTGTPGTADYLVQENQVKLVKIIANTVNDIPDADPNWTPGVAHLPIIKYVAGAVSVTLSEQLADNGNFELIIPDSPGVWKNAHIGLVKRKEFVYYYGQFTVDRSSGGRRFDMVPTNTPKWAAMPQIYDIPTASNFISGNTTGDVIINKHKFNEQGKLFFRFDVIGQANPTQGQVAEVSGLWITFV